MNYRAAALAIVLGLCQAEAQVVSLPVRVNSSSSTTMPRQGSSAAASAFAPNRVVVAYGRNMNLDGTALAISLSGAVYFGPEQVLTGADCDGTPLSQFANPTAVASAVNGDIWVQALAARAGAGGSAWGSSTWRIPYGATTPSANSVVACSAGWTEIEFDAANAQKVYVAANGNDQNDGLSPSTPKQHISAVLQAQPPLIRPGRGDWLLLRRGDTFNESIGFWTTAGASAKYPQRIGMYLASGQPPSTPRPIVDPPNSGGFGNPGFIASGSSSNPVRYVAITDLDFRNTAYTGTVVGSDGVSFLGLFSDILIEGCSFYRLNNGVICQSDPPVDGDYSRRVSIRRCQFRDLFRFVDDRWPSGVFADGIDNLLIEDCLFDHCGWRRGDSPSIYPTVHYPVQTHATYIKGPSGHSSRNALIRNSIVIDTYSDGQTAEAGVVSTGGLYLRNPYAIWLKSPGAVFDATILDSRDIRNDLSGLTRASGVGVEGGDGVVCCGALTAHRVAAPPPNPGAFTVNNGSSGVTLEDCRAYAWPTGSGSSYIENGHIFVGGGTPSPTRVRCQLPAAPSSPRTIASYLSSINVPPGLDPVATFADLAWAQWRENWSNEPTAPAAASYIRSGYGFADRTFPKVTAAAQLAVGPSAGGGAETMYCIHAGREDTGVAHTKQATVLRPSATASPSWDHDRGELLTKITVTPQQQVTAAPALPTSGAALAVLATSGQLVAVHEGALEGRLPVAWWSPTGGRFVAGNQDSSWNVSIGQANVPIFSRDSANTGIVAFDPLWVSGYTDGSAFRVHNWPSVAADPTNPDDPVLHNGWVYVAYCGHDPAEPGQNIDIYIARSVNGGRTFLPANTLRLTDAILQPPNNLIQIRPSIAVDACGGVNLFYYQYHVSNMSAGEHWYEPRYLRIPSFPSTAGIFKASLGPWFMVQTNEFMGDYDRMAAAGNTLYIPHTSKDADGSWNVYCNKVTVQCVIADVDSNQEINVIDASTFTAWYSVADPRADLNHDGAVDLSDQQLFCASYACGCNP
jgi:hypothetical protein